MPCRASAPRSAGPAPSAVSDPMVPARKACSAPPPDPRRDHSTGAQHHQERDDGRDLEYRDWDVRIRFTPRLFLRSGSGKGCSRPIL